MSAIQPVQLPDDEARLAALRLHAFSRDTQGGYFLFTIRTRLTRIRFAKGLTLR